VVSRRYQSSLGLVEAAVLVALAQQLWHLRNIRAAPTCEGAPQYGRRARGGCSPCTLTARAGAHRAGLGPGRARLCAHATGGQPSLTSHHYQRGETIRWDPAADNPNRWVQPRGRSSKGYHEADGVGVLVGPALGGFLAIQCRDADCLRQGIIPGGKSRGNLRPFFVAIGSIQCPLPEKRARPFTSQLNIANMATRHQFEENCVSTAKRARTEARSSKEVVPAHLGKQLFADAVGADGVAHCWCCGAPMLSSCEECVMHMARTGEKLTVGVRGHTTAENSGPIAKSKTGRHSYVPY
jgi:hypothetical protein